MPLSKRNPSLRRAKFLDNLRVINTGGTALIIQKGPEVLI